MQQITYSRILLKLSGEFLAGVQQQQAIDLCRIDRLLQEMDQLRNQGVQIGIVIGGGNVLRGESLSTENFDRENRRLHGNASNSYQWHGITATMPGRWYS